MLAFGQTCEVAAGEEVPAPLQPGEASLHSFLTVHRSGENRCSWPRAGLAIRYMAGDVKRARGDQRESATLVLGEDQGHFDLESSPRELFGNQEIAAWEDAMARERANYFANRRSCSPLTTSLGNSDRLPAEEAESDDEGEL
eukprot:TRINITY_DN40339_c0_g1_i1.p3 TRINITY_DN40339_c0_g1~~TRINITY_DN40339_c0_g1_i1.p3  ORF type:complete len:142 (+),score=28.91 TRINITY_DN40339_c0_g1_i1:609-1034(+)